MISLELQAPELNNNHVRLHIHDQFPFRFPPYLIPVAVVALVVPKYLDAALCLHLLLTSENRLFHGYGEDII